MEYIKPTYDEAMKRFKASRERKKAYLAELEQEMRHDYKTRTGMEAKYFFAL